MLEFKNVSKRFGRVEALKDISFRIEDGEFVFVTGPSGAGKTTLIRLVIREIIPDEGEILFDDKLYSTFTKNDLPGLRQKIGVVFQDFKLLNEKTVAENVEIALAVIGVPEKEWEARVNHVLKLVDLEKRAHFFPSQLSGGELQRVTMARSLVVNPRIILADEPTGNLDWDSADKIMDLFDRINKEGKTLLVATHNKLIVDKMKKRVIELSDGKIISDKRGKGA